MFNAEGPVGGKGYRTALLAVIMAIAVSIACIALSDDPGKESYADTSGSCGEHMTWEVADGTLTITGYGAMNNYGQSDTNKAPWKNLGVTAIVFVSTDPGITHIGDYAFYSCSAATTVTGFPSTVTSIGNKAFYQCTNFTGPISLSNSITSIGADAFHNCKKLEGVLPTLGNLTTLGDYAFRFCEKLTGSINFTGSALTSLGLEAFSGCSSLNGTLTLPEGLTSIPNHAFKGCSGLTGGLSIPSNVTSIGNHAFDGCTGLNGAFTPPTGNFSIGEFAFSNCKNITGSLPLLTNVTVLSKGAFYGCSGLTGPIDFTGTSFTAIEDSVFNGCSGLTSITFPANLTSIGASTFSLCTGLTGGLSIPSNVTSIGNSAFYKCTGLNGNLSLPSGIQSIGDSAFYNCAGLTGTLPTMSSLTTLEQSAFQNCSSLTGGINLTGSSITEIKYGTFKGCTGLNGALTLPSGLTEILSYAFENCENLSGALALPSGLQKIGVATFHGCESFTSLSIPSSVTDIGIEGSTGPGTFQGCSGLTGSLTIPAATTEIGAGAFSGCSGLDGTLTFQGSTVTLGANAFQGTNFLTIDLTSCTSLTATNSFPSHTFFIDEEMTSQIDPSDDEFTNHLYKGLALGGMLQDPYYQITYDGNGHDSGVVPVDSTVYLLGDNGTVLDPSDPSSAMGRFAYYFAGWNTEKEGGGVAYSPLDPITVNGTTILYAQWTFDLTSIAVTEAKDSYLEGQLFDPSTLVIECTFAHPPTPVSVSYESERKSHFTFDPPLTQPLTRDDTSVTIGFYGVTVDLTIGVQVMASISVLDSPKTEYTEGETFDPSGLTIKCTYTGGATLEIPYAGHESEFSFDPLLIQRLVTTDDSVRISFNGFSTDLDIVVSVKQLIGIELETLPDIEYKEGETFDPSDLVIIRHYSDGSQDTVSYEDDPDAFSFDPPLTKALKSSVKNIIITYAQDGKTASVRLGITVSNGGSVLDEDDDDYPWGPLPSTEPEGTNYLWIIIAIAACAVLTSAIFIWECRKRRFGRSRGGAPGIHRSMAIWHIGTIYPYWGSNRYSPGRNGPCHRE